MTSLHRAASVAMAILVLQLPLLNATAPCTHHDAGAQAGAAAAVAGHAECDDAEGAADAPSGDSRSCPMMATCSATMVQLAAPAEIVTADPAIVAVESRASELTTRSTAPELPPPRV